MEEIGSSAGNQQPLSSGRPVAVGEVKLNHKVLQQNVKRLRRALQLYVNIYHSVEAFQAWKNPYKTGICLLVYILCMRYQVMLPTALLVVLALFYRSHLVHGGFLQRSYPLVDDDVKMGLRDKVKALTNVRQQISALLPPTPFPFPGTPSYTLSLPCHRRALLLHLSTWIYLQSPKHAHPSTHPFPLLPNPMDAV